MYSWGATVTTPPMARSGAVSSCAAQWELAELVSFFVTAFACNCARSNVSQKWTVLQRVYGSDVSIVYGTSDVPRSILVSR